MPKLGMEPVRRTALEDTELGGKQAPHMGAFLRRGGRRARIPTT